MRAQSTSAVETQRVRRAAKDNDNTAAGVHTAAVHTAAFAGMDKIAALAGQGRAWGRACEEQLSIESFVGQSGSVGQEETQVDRTTAA